MIKASKLLCSTAILATTIAAASRGGDAAEMDCRSTTSTQTLDCQGIRCRPDYSGGCDGENEYTKSSTQRSCVEPGPEQIGTAAICYYDDVCCPADQWGADAAAGQAEDGNDHEEGGRGATTSMEEDARRNNDSNPHPRNASGTEENGGAGIVFGLALAIVIVVIAALFIATTRRRGKNEGDAADFDSDGEDSRSAAKHANKRGGERFVCRNGDDDDSFSRGSGSGEIKIPMSVRQVMTEESNLCTTEMPVKKKKKRRKRGKRTIHGDDGSFSQESGEIRIPGKEHRI